MSADPNIEKFLKDSEEYMSKHELRGVFERLMRELAIQRPKEPYEFLIDVLQKIQAEKKLLKLAIAGPPASGKGTQCMMIRQKFGLVHLSTGDILRDQIAKGTELGLKAKEFMDRGALVPDDLIIGIILDRLKEKDCNEKGWLLDGFPRTAAQAQVMKQKGIIPDCFLLLDIADEAVIERISGRRFDPVTGDTYHIVYNPCTNPEVRNRLIQRSDDNEETIKTRLSMYHANLRPILDTFPQNIIKIGANQAIDKVSADIKTSLNELCKKKGIAPSS